MAAPRLHAPHIRISPAFRPVSVHRTPRVFPKWLIQEDHPYLDWERPIAFAHRGGMGIAPECTNAAFDTAVGLGYTYIELDVQLSKDGVLMVMHDSTLSRTTDMKGAVSDFTRQELQAADAGYRYTKDRGKSYPYRGRGLRIPTLEETLKRYPNVRFNIDPKAVECAAPLIGLITKMNAMNRVGISCSSDKTIEEVRKLAPGRICTAMSLQEAVRAYAASRRGPIPPQGANYIQAPLYRKGIGIIDRRFVRAAHQSGLRVHVWTINDEATMNYLLDIGCDGITSDRPDILKKVLVERGEWLEASRHGKRFEKIKGILHLPSRPASRGVA